MRRLTYYVATTIDGFIAEAGGSFGSFRSAGDHLAALFATFPETVPARELAPEIDDLRVRR